MLFEASTKRDFRPLRQVEYSHDIGLWSPERRPLTTRVHPTRSRIADEHWRALAVAMATSSGSSWWANATRLGSRPFFIKRPIKYSG